MDTVMDTTMVDTIHDVFSASSETEMCMRMGEYLGLDSPAPLAVVRRAVIDGYYASYLTRSRYRLDTLAVLFRDPKNRMFEEPDSTSGRKPPPEHSALKLMLSATKAVGTWGASGFKQLDPEALAARLAACTACEHLVEAPNKLIYKVRLSPQSEQRICNECGCSVSRKTRIPTEKCPSADPDRPGFNRWGQSLRSTA